MKSRFLLALFAGFAAAPAFAQTADLGEPLAEGGEVESIEVAGEETEGPLRGTVTDESDWSDIGVAIPAFATDRNRPTPASSDGTEALGREIARVITANLRDNGLFQPVGPDSLPQPEFPQITDPAWGNWSGRGAEMLVHGYVRARDDEKLVVGCYLYDVALRDELIRE